MTRDSRPPSATLERARAQTQSGVACIILSLYSPKLVDSTDNWLVLPLRLSCQAGWYDDIGVGSVCERTRHIQQYGLDSFLVTNTSTTVIAVTVAIARR